MAANSDIKQHISSTERAKWNKIGTDLETHVGAGGTENHPLATGSVPGFSMCDFTTELKSKLDSVERNANAYTHPKTHAASMITGLADIATTGDWNNLLNIPTAVTQVINNNYDSKTVSGGIRLTIGASSPTSPQVNKEIWIDTNNLVLKFYDGTWKIIGAAFR